MLPAFETHYAHATHHQTEFLSADEAILAIQLIEKIQTTGVLKQPYHLKSRNIDELQEDIMSGFPLIGIKSASGKLIGCITVSPHANPTNVTIRTLCIDHDFVGQGLAKKLVETAIDWAHRNGQKNIIAKVALDNTDSLIIFEKQGFTPVHTAIDTDGGYTYHLMGKNLNGVCLQQSPSRMSASSAPSLNFGLAAA